MKARRLVVFLLVFAFFAQCAALAGTGAAGVAPAADRLLPTINNSEFTLANGLHVILHEDHSTPIVAVNIWYHVGSKNEVPGRTGFAHLFEHMMFQGSKNYDENYFTPIQEAGGNLNGSTNTDRTNYWEVVPSNFLELAIFMEADRMGTLPDAMTMAKLNNQRDVVKNEKRQRYDNVPYGTVGAKIAETLYPPSHPYHWLTIGSLEDLTAASLDDVKDFFRRFYTPNNASLCIAGDFNPAEAKQWVQKYFGPIKRGPETRKLNVAQPVLDKEIRMTIDDRAVLARDYMTWHTVPHFAKDEAALNMLAAILAGGRTSRLYKSLVYDKQTAQMVNAFNGSRELAGTFQITATARPQRNPDDVKKNIAEIERAVDAEIERIKAEPPTADELARVYNSIEAEFVYGLQTVGGFGGKSDQLNAYQTFTGRPDYFERDLERYRQVTPADIQRVAREYLTDKRLVLTVMPRAGGGGGDRTARRPEEASAEADQPTSAAGAKKGTSAEALKANLPKPKPDPTLRLPRVERRKLSNGLDVEFVRYDKLPIVNLHLLIKSGGAADTNAKSGLSSLTAAMMEEGTKSRSSLDISNALANVGARFNISSNWDSTSANLLTTTRQLDPALDVFADVIANPAFPAQEFSRIKRQRLIALQQQRDNANAIANIVYSSLLYGNTHPYGRSLTGTSTTLTSLTRDDVQHFYDTYYRPNNATLVVVGDVDAAALMPKLEKAFANWKSADVPRVDLATGALPQRDKAKIYLVDRPGAAQSVIEIGQVGVARSTPDYFPLLVLNTILGGSFISRVNLNLREDKGYTYGARTAFEYRMGAGPFVATAGVQTAVTKQAVVEFMRELNDIRGKRPASAAEIEYAKQAIIRRFPAGFETPGEIATNLSTAALFGLPDDYFNSYISQVRAVTESDVNRVAQKYLDPSHMAILVVGDQRAIEQGLRSLDNLGASVVLLDSEGQPAAKGESAGGTK